MDSPHRQQIILQLLDTADEIDALTVMNVINTDTQTLTRDFRELLTDWKIQQSHPGHYTKPCDTLTYLSQAISKRSEQNYYEDILVEYVPNIDSLLWEELLKQLSHTHKHVIYDFRKNLEGIENVYLHLSYYSNTLAGWELDILDTEIFLKFGKSPKWKSFQHSQRILNYKNILDLLFSEKDFIFSSKDFQEIHKILMVDRLDNSQRGKLRTSQKEVSKSTYKPIHNPQILQVQFHVFIEKLQKIKNPFEKSFFIFVFLPYILPFSEWNKELARICMNIPLIQNGCSVITFENISSEEYELAYRAYYELQDLSFLTKIFLSFFKNPSENN